MTFRPIIAAISLLLGVNFAAAQWNWPTPSPQAWYEAEQLAVCAQIYTALVERCIAKDPSRRPASARAVHEELLAIERVVEQGQARRGQLVVVLALLGAILVVGVGAVAAWRF